jgi:hypothetical protein
MRPVSIISVILLVLVSLRVEASPPELVPAPAPKPKRFQRILQPLRNFSLKTANRCRNLYERTPPGIRHSGMTLLTAAATTYSACQFAGRGAGSIGGTLALTGVVLGISGALHHGKKTLRAVFPDKMKAARQRLEQSAIVGPWLRDSRPWFQRLKSRFRRRAQGDGS